MKAYHMMEIINLNQKNAEKKSWFPIKFPLHYHSFELIFSYYGTSISLNESFDIFRLGFGAVPYYTSSVEIILK